MVGRFWGILGICCLAGAFFVKPNVVAWQFCPLEIKVSTLKTSFLTREPIPFRITLTNQGSKPVVVPKMQKEDWLLRVKLQVTYKLNGKRQTLFLQMLWIADDYGRMLPEQGRAVVLPPKGKIISPWLNALDATDCPGGDAPSAPLQTLLESGQIKMKVLLLTAWCFPEEIRMRSVDLSQKLALHIEPPKTERSQHAFLLLQFAVTERSVTDDDIPILRAYNIPVTDEGKILLELREYLRTIRDTFPETIYAAEAAYLYAEQLRGSWEYEQKPPLKDVVAAYKWILKHHPKSWWAYKALEALKELQQSGR